MGFTLAFALLGAALTSTSLLADGGNSQDQQKGTTHRGLVKTNNYVVLKTIPHAPRAFTQGLQYLSGGIFIEGTGLYGHSTLRKVESATGKVLASVNLDRKYFGEGITVVDDKIVQITWREKQAFVYNLNDLSRRDAFNYDTFNHEGWGITTDGQELIVSDGSQFIYFWDKNTYQETRRIRVEDGFGVAVNMLNELEYAHGYIWANIWLADDIVQIDPQTGKVVAFYDLSTLYPTQQRSKVDDVLNGIAFDPTEDVFYLTGKNWPLYYKVAFCDLPSQQKHCHNNDSRQ